VADAGAPQFINLETPQLVSLDGTRSFDPDGDSLTYAWTKLSGPAVTLKDPLTATPTFTADPVSQDTPIVLQLKVSDGTLSASAQTTVTLLAGTPRKTGGKQRPGDATQDGKLDLSDAIWLLEFLFQGGHSLPCDGAGAAGPNPGALALLDSNGDGRLDLSDAVFVLAFLFQGGNHPVLGTSCVPIPACADKCSP
jgi:hypothetical protein